MGKEAISGPEGTNLGSGANLILESGPGSALIPVNLEPDNVVAIGVGSIGGGTGPVAYCTGPGGRDVTGGGLLITFVPAVPGITGVGPTIGVEDGAITFLEEVLTGVGPALTTFVEVGAIDEEVIAFADPRVVAEGEPAVLTGAEEEVKVEVGLGPELLIADVDELVVLVPCILLRIVPPLLVEVVCWHAINTNSKQTRIKSFIFILFSFRFN